MKKMNQNTEINQIETQKQFNRKTSNQLEGELSQCSFPMGGK